MRRGSILQYYPKFWACCLTKPNVCIGIMIWFRVQFGRIDSIDRFECNKFDQFRTRAILSL